MERNCHIPFLTIWHTDLEQLDAIPLRMTLASLRHLNAGALVIRDSNSFLKRFPGHFRPNAVFWYVIFEPSLPFIHLRNAWYQFLCSTSLCGNFVIKWRWGMSRRISLRHIYIRGTSRITTWGRRQEALWVAVSEMWPLYSSEIKQRIKIPCDAF